METKMQENMEESNKNERVKDEGEKRKKYIEVKSFKEVTTKVRKMS